MMKERETEKQRKGEEEILAQRANDPERHSAYLPSIVVLKQFLFLSPSFQFFFPSLSYPDDLLRPRSPDRTEQVVLEGHGYGTPKEKGEKVQEDEKKSERESERGSQERTSFRPSQDGEEV